MGQRIENRGWRIEDGVSTSYSRRCRLHHPSSILYPRRAFTLVELLVVIAIIGILAALLLPAISRVKDKAIRTKCLSNIKQFDLGVLSYGHDNRDLLPTGQDEFEPWDLPWAMCDMMMKQYGLTRGIMYDPGFPQQDTDGAWNDVPGQLRDIGYAMTLPGLTWLQPQYQNAKIVPEPQVIGSVVLPPPMISERVLVAGLVLSEGPQYQTDAVSRASYNYTQLYVDNKVAGGVTRCPHLLGKMPRGDNLGMLDGSGKWRNFRDMVPRTSGAAGGITLWW